MPKVSIIIPFNNVENYIEQCLNSVLSQTLSDIEVILINDASNDKTRDIVQKYIEQDCRIKIIDLKEQKGQGFARNRGIEISEGEYIGFVDSDDFIETNMFEELYNAAKEGDTDITMCEVREYDDLNDKYKMSDYYSLGILSTFENSVFSAEDTKNEILDINVALWNKIYRRDYLINLGEKFPEGFIYEDLPFFFGTYLPAKKINIVWKVLYNYRINRKNSTMRQFNNKILDRLPMVSLTYEKLKNIPFLSEMKQKIQGWIINDLFHRYVLLKENYHKEFFFQMKKIFENLEIENKYDSYWRKVYHFKGYLLVINNNFETFNQRVFTEYLNLHEMENRIRSEIPSTKDIDRRFNLMYDDLSKSYKYAEKLCGGLRNGFEKEISDVQSQAKELKNEISDTKEYFLNTTNETFADIYKEISSNSIYSENLKNELTWELQDKSKNLYNDIKDLTYVLHDNYVEAGKETERLRVKSEETVVRLEELAKEFQDRLNFLKSEIQSQTDKKFKENGIIINKINSDLLHKIDDIETSFRVENNKNTVQINNMKNEFINIINIMKQENNNQIQILKKEIEQLREEMKSPWQKFMENRRNK